jgi:hypothetical protein
MTDQLFNLAGNPVEKARVIETTRGSVRANVAHDCPRCGGSGHVYWGTCFLCGGARHVVRTERLYTADQLPKAQARKAKAQATKEAKAKAKLDEQAARLSAAIREFELTGIYAAMKLSDARPQAMTHHTQRRYAKAKQAREAFETCARIGSAQLEKTAHWLKDAWASYLELAQTIRTEDQLKEEARQNQPKEWIHPGRYEVTGIVAGIKESASQWGSSVKAIVKDGLRTYYVTIPRGVEAEGLRGRAVSFTATIERSDRDPLFGFASRPSKWLVVG